MKKPFQNNVLIGIMLSLAAFLVYLRTLAPTVGFMDSGELAAAASTLGIAHPTGYPLFTLIGWVFAHLPIGGRVIWKLNLMAAVECSVAIFLFYRLFLLLLSERMQVGLGTRKFPVSQKGKIAEPKTIGSEEGFAASIASLLLAFSETYWSQAVSVEVYSLHLLLLSLVLFLFLKSILEHVENPGTGENRTWYAFAFLLSLSFTNHMTTILLAPGFLYLYFSTHGFRRTSWAKIGKAAVPFCIGLSLYLYLPLRARRHPTVDWGDPGTFQKFWRHFSGGDFHDKMFSSFDVTAQQLGHFVTGFPSEFGYAPLAFMFLGWLYLFRYARKILWFSIFLFLGCLFYSVNYDIPDIGSYFLLAYVAASIWMAYGIQAILKRARGARQRWISWGLCSLVVLFSLLFHYHAADESQDYAPEDFTNNLLNSLDSGGIVLVSDRSESLRPTFDYLQWVEGVRPDVVLINENLLTRPWYYAQLKNRYPWLIRNSQKEVDAFLAANAKLDSDATPLDSAVARARFDEVVWGLLWDNSPAHPIYITSELLSQVKGKAVILPSGLAFRLFRDRPAIPILPKEFSYRPFPKSTYYIEQIKSFYAAAYTNEGLYGITRLGDTAIGIALLQKALAVKPDFQSASDWLMRLSH